MSGWAQLVASLAGAWKGASLVRRFALAGGGVMCIAMGLLGLWVSDRIAQGVLRQSASNSAHFVDAVFSPLGEALEGGGPLSPGAARAVEEVLAAAPLRDRIVSFKLWSAEGAVLFASEPALIGQRFPPSPALRAALAGEVSADLDSLDDAESAGERALGRPLLEIYAPVRAEWSGRIVAVMEFYEVAEALEAELAAARAASWLVVAGVMSATGLSLLGIVGAGSRTIREQRGALETQVAELARIGEANRDLRRKVQRASAGAAETNERYLGRIGADLHDGPAQLLSLAALRLDAIETAPCPDTRAAETAEIRRALAAAMADIRNISRGLVLPELRGRTVAATVRRAADIHMALTRTEVALELDAPETVLPHPALIAVYRFVQEGLSNATRHADGAGMAVALRTPPGGPVTVEVRDAGPGLPAAAPPGDEAGTRLGLRGLAERIESLGGSFEIETRPGAGVTLRLTLHPEGGPET